MKVRRIAHITEGGRKKDTGGRGQGNGEGGLGKGALVLGSSPQDDTEIENEFEPEVSRSAGIE